MNIRVLFSLLLCLCCFACAETQKKESLVLWYNEPSENWNEALPIGNGRAGAM
ncbi:glycoside hydrolase N-terminal domain-containing protein, partial [Parabacteroides goldsteinii]